MKRSGRVGGLAILLAATSMLLSAAGASAAVYVYWGNEGTTSIGRADVDGASNNPMFIPGTDRVSSIATDKTHIYWASVSPVSPYPSAIGRADIDGSNVQPKLIPVPSFASGVAVDSSHLYWSQAGDGTIGRANLDGTNPQPNFVTGLNAPNGIAVDGSHIYWASYGNGNPGSGKIGYATLGGQIISPALVTGINSPSDVEVDASHIYWLNTFASHSIGRADINGGNPTQSFIATTTDQCALAIDSEFQNIWWSNVNGTTLGRANLLDGSGRSDSAVSGLSEPCGLDVDHGFLVPNTTPSNAFSFGKLKRNRRKGTAKLPVSVPGPGMLTLTGKGVKPQRPARPTNPARTVGAAGTVKLRIVSRGKAKRKLRRSGSVKLKLTITFTPNGGTANAKSKKLKLIKRG